MIKDRFLHRKLACAVAVGCMLTAMACAPKKEDVAGTEVLETDWLETEVVEQAESTGGEGAGETQTETPTEYKSENTGYTVTALEKIMYASATVNVRTGPDTSYEKLGELSVNQEMQVIGVCDEMNWYCVAYNGEVGFVHGNYLSDEKVSSWVADLDIAETASQIIVVAAYGNEAKLSMHNRAEDGTWTEKLFTIAEIGRNGIGKTKEGDGKTPTGVYRFLFGFGNMPDPGCGLAYMQVDDSYYWVDDSDSAYYNQFVSTNEVTKDWDSAEHIAGVKSSYNYVLALDYNVDCVPQKGSAIFMHCTPTSGAGCIAIPEDVMVEIMQNVEAGCVVVIDSVEGVKGY